MTSPSGVLADYAYTGMQDASHTIVIADEQCFTVPRDGYILSASTHTPSKFWSDIDKSPEALFVNLCPSGSTLWHHAFISQYTKDIGAQSFTLYIPVNKGDKIAVGVQFQPSYKKEILPPWCAVTYYPIKLKDASSIWLVFSQNSVLVPDYSKPLKIVGEASYGLPHGGAPIFDGLQSGIGGWASKESHYYMKTSHYDSGGGYYHTFTPNENLSYIIPSSGYLAINLSYTPWYRSDLTHGDRDIYFWIALVRDGHEYDIASLYVAANSLGIAKGAGTQVPVRKGDKIYWGGLLEAVDTSYPQRNICEYSITFYPALTITAGSE